MQFKNPEVFYLLFLLLIPLLVHLFQLQKFVNVPFTNVAFLKKIEANTRKSSTLKKWIILCTRTLGLLALLIAFSQPYLSNKTSLEKPETNIYFDNSLSISGINSNGYQYQNLVNQIIENAPYNGVYNLITNSNKFENLSYNGLKNELLKLKLDTKNQNLESFLLENQTNSDTKSNTSIKNILITDFQNIKYSLFTNVTGRFYGIIPKNDGFSNLFIDSLSLTSNVSEYFNLTANIKNSGPKKDNVSIAIYNDKILMAKQVFSIEANTTTPISLNLKKEKKLLGKISITLNDTFDFDNTFYFSLNNTQKTKVLIIGKADEMFSKIFTNDEFTFTQVSPQNVNYNTLSKNDLIICNEINALPKSLENGINEFKQKGGSLVLIPSKESDFKIEKRLLGIRTNFSQQPSIDTLRISKLNTSHPFFNQVFTEKVENFSYPFVKESNQINSNLLNGIVNYENNYLFFSNLRSNDKVFLFSSSLSKENSNFRNSPLAVTLFYTLGQLSFRQPKLYYHINSNESIDIKTSLNKNQILTIKSNNQSFIPLQKSLQNKVELNFEDQVLEAGFHYVIKEKDTISVLAMNNPKSESSATFMDPNVFNYSTNPIKTFDSVEAIFDTIKDFNEVNWLWKWFISLAIVSLLAEILLLKFFKV